MGDSFILGLLSLAAAAGALALSRAGQLDIFDLGAAASGMAGVAALTIAAHERRARNRIRKG